jgi:hypothetical protein
VGLRVEVLIMALGGPKGRSFDCGTVGLRVEVLIVALGGPKGRSFDCGTGWAYG